MKNKNDVKIMLREAGILFAITLIAGLVLGFVYELTKEPIRIQQELAVQKACKAVFAEADNFEALQYIVSEGMAVELAENGVEIGTVFEARNHAGKTLGHVVETISREGYGGNIILYVGVTNDGTLNDISLLKISETPGLGMLAGDVLVPQFSKKKVEQFTYTKTGSLSDSEIDAISGATVTTRAVTNAVNGGLKVAANLREEGAGNE